MIEHQRIPADIAAILRNLEPQQRANLHAATWALLEHLRSEPETLAAVLELIADRIRTRSEP